MRIAGGHALGEEAAGVVQQAVSLAGRRGHAQVTPLHIASAMLSVPSSAGIFRAACVRSQSHPLQHNALELCLNLALDQLKLARPAMASAVANGGARVDPVPSNAFAAALKRAQAHRRQDGKVEPEQLVLSILDDPSVDRVMRAAGFSSSQVVRASVENVILSEKADRAGGQPSLQAVHVPDHGRRNDIALSKMAVARELARLVFGSHTDFTVLQPGNSDEPTRSGNLTSKRRRSPDDGDGGYAGARLFETIVENPHRVIFIDGVDRLDRDSEMRIKDVIMEGTVRGHNGDVVRLDDAIVVLCSDVLNWRYVVSSPRVKPRLEEEGDATGKEVRPRPRLPLDLNACPEDGEDEHDILADGEAILKFVDGVFFFN